MGAMLWWPAVTLLGFLLFTTLVVALGTSSTSRYEFERNATRAPARTVAESKAAHPSSGPAASRPVADSDGQARPQAVEVAVRPVTTAAGGESGWWLIDGSAEVLAGPFPDRIDADWAALAEGLVAVSVFGARRADGGIVPRHTAQERAWLGELGEQLDRIPDDWDDLLSDTDPLTTLLVEVAAALVEAGLPLYDAAGTHAGGGVCLVPELGSLGVLISWRSHDRMSIDHVRGAPAEAAVQQLMSVTLAGILEELGFVVEPCRVGGGFLVTALR
jgi:hypothetical protein